MHETRARFAIRHITHASILVYSLKIKNSKKHFKLYFDGKFATCRYCFCVPCSALTTVEMTFNMILNHGEHLNEKNKKNKKNPHPPSPSKKEERINKNKYLRNLCSPPGINPDWYKIMSVRDVLFNN